MKKRVFIHCLILLLCLAASACAETLATGQCGEKVTWALDDEGTLTISGSGPMEEYYEGTNNSYTLYSPPFWDWKNDGNPAENRRQIKKVVIEEGVTTAGGGAFRDLDGLVKIELASSVKTIGACTFSNDTAIQEITIPATITSLGHNAFDHDTSLREVSIPASVTSIGDRVFYECTSLQNINVDANNPAYKSADGVLFTRDGTVMLSYCPGRTATSYTIPDGVQMIRPSAFSYTSALEEVNFPATLTEIENWAFGHTGLKSVVLPENLKTLRFCVFGACENLAEVSVPAALATVEEWAFGDGAPFTAVYYEGSEEQWKEISFTDDNDKFLAAPISYDVQLYVHCDHPSLTYQAAIPHTCTADGIKAHWVCDECGGRFADAQGTTRARNLTDPAAHSYRSEITLMPTCCEPGVLTFTCTECDAQTAGHSYTEEVAATRRHHFTDGVCDNLRHDGKTVCGVEEAVQSGTCGDELTWRLDSLGTLTISGSGRMENYRIISTTIYNHGVPFSTTSYLTTPWSSYLDDVQAVIVEEGVTYIGNLAFVRMPNLQYVRFPSTVSSTGGQIFASNNKLTDIYYEGTDSAWSMLNVSDTLNYIKNNEIKVHYAAVNNGTCGANATWSIDEDGTLRISGSGTMTSFVDEQGFLLARPWNAWESNGSIGELPHRIRKIVIGNGITSIGDGAFRELCWLEDVQIADSVKSIGGWAFNADPWLKEITIPAGVTKIGDRVFYECTGLEKINVNSANTAYKSVDGVLFTKDGKQLVSYCPGRRDASYTIPDGVCLIHPSAFSYTASLQEVKFPDSLETISDWAFGHTGLLSIVLSEGVETLQHSVFGFCEALQTATLPASLIQIGENVFYGCPLRSVGYAGTEDQWDEILISKEANPEIFSAELSMQPGEVRKLEVPADLTEIRESAFEGGIFRQVYLGKKVTSIGAKAFANCVKLKEIHIPATCTEIAADAFEGSEKVTIVCPAGSAAYQYATDHGISVRTEE